MGKSELLSNERVDDIPLLINQMKKLELSELIDEHFKAHGNWQGLSIGMVVVGWLSYILSQGDHCMNHVQGWAEGLQSTLGQCLEEAVRPLDFSDDRLEQVLDHLSEDERWDAFEGALSAQTIRVYGLMPECVRIDTTTTSGYRICREDGLFQFGHSKDHRKDLPQVKIVQSALDPLGLPISTSVVGGDCADDPLYIPEIERVRQSVQPSGLLYVGDSKMSAIATRCHIDQTHNYYLSPLSSVQVPSQRMDELLEGVWSGTQPLTMVEAPIDPEESSRSQKIAEPPIAEGFSITLKPSVGEDDEKIDWEEQWVVVHSFKHQTRQKKGLDQRLARAKDAIEALNLRGRGHKHRNLQETQSAAEAILKRYRVSGLLMVEYHTQEHITHKRAYKDRPAYTLTTITVNLTSQINSALYEQTVRRFGWRVYACNDMNLSVQKVVYAYRNEYLIERCFGRYKGKALGLHPLFLKSDERVKGLIRLLSIGLRVLSLLEFAVRSALKDQKQDLAGLYAGNPKRATRKPTAERLLQAFEGITLTCVRINGDRERFLSPLTPIQQKILQYLCFDESIYLELTL